MTQSPTEVRAVKAAKGAKTVDDTGDGTGGRRKLALKAAKSSLVNDDADVEPTDSDFDLEGMGVFA
eukprot:CAMPEP_0198126222 /NCGR_PEP_ID=MMETSP1442-20131203/44325_1 /TAXON_ID= /ORGANISM="Craspedostauros australis, Strain CCMP3328" /LENGTH=65 /DNA_ID=CAMNT_0043785971 /DNA_START=93 /DNA_END=290 /DNA_ORIENTATION=+